MVVCHVAAAKPATFSDPAVLDAAAETAVEWSDRALDGNIVRTAIRLEQIVSCQRKTLSA